MGEPAKVIGFFGGEARVDEVLLGTTTPGEAKSTYSAEEAPSTLRISVMHGGAVQATRCVAVSEPGDRGEGVEEKADGFTWVAGVMMPERAVAYDDLRFLGIEGDVIARWRRRADHKAVWTLFYRNTRVLQELLQDGTELTR